MSDATELGCFGVGVSMVGGVLLFGGLLMGDCAGCVDVAEIVHGKPATIQVTPTQFHQIQAPQLPTRVVAPVAPAAPVVTKPRPMPPPECETAIRVTDADGDVEWSCLDDLGQSLERQ